MDEMDEMDACTSIVLHLRGVPLSSRPSLVMYILWERLSFVYSLAHNILEYQLLCQHKLSRTTAVHHFNASIWVMQHQNQIRMQSSESSALAFQEQQPLHLGQHWQSFWMVRVIMVVHSFFVQMNQSLRDGRKSFVRHQYRMKRTKEKCMVRSSLLWMVMLAAQICQEMLSWKSYWKYILTVWSSVLWEMQRSGGNRFDL